jgi:Na+/melibiose symporter-like transporter
LDLFLERFSSDKDTGFIRGSYFTAGNIAFIIAPFVASLLIDGGNYWKIFSVATIIMIIALCSLLLNLSDHIDTTYEKISFFETLKKIWWNKDINHIMTTSFLLQFFYAWMTIYGLLYLRDVILLPEKTILGIIMPIALIPFVLFELFLGDIADKLFGEKEILTIGFIIMGISTITMYFATSTDLWFWAGLLFMTRVGASFVEIMNETYFYKKVDATEASLIAFYKNMKPIAFLIAPILATIILTSTGSYQSLFFILGVIVLSGTLFSATIKDTL